MNYLGVGSPTLSGPSKKNNTVKLKLYICFTSPPPPTDQDFHGFWELLVFCWSILFFLFFLIFVCVFFFYFACQHFSDESPPPTLKNDDMCLLSLSNHSVFIYAVSSKCTKWYNMHGSRRRLRSEVMGSGERGSSPPTPNPLENLKITKLTFKITENRYRTPPPENFLDLCMYSIKTNVICVG